MGSYASKEEEHEVYYWNIDEVIKDYSPPTQFTVNDVAYWSKRRESERISIPAKDEQE